MRRAPALATFCAVAVVAVACGSRYFSDDPDAGAASEAGVDGAVDAANDAPGDDASDAAAEAASPCALPHDFCDDFDREGGLTGARFWDRVVTDPGTSIAPTTDAYESPPQAVRIRAALDSTNSFRTLYLTKHLDATHSQIRCAVDVRIDEHVAPGHGVVLLHIELGTPGVLGQVLWAAHVNTNVSSGIQSDFGRGDFLPDGGALDAGICDERWEDCRGPDLVAGEWLHAVLTFGKDSFSLVASSPSLKETQFGPFATRALGDGTFDVGIGRWSEGPGGSWGVLFDNFACDFLP
jgi:hypothetical protein